MVWWLILVEKNSTIANTDSDNSIVANGCSGSSRSSRTSSSSNFIMTFLVTIRIFFFN